MIIAGIDPSITSTAIVKFDLNNSDLSIKDINYFGFIEKKTKKGLDSELYPGIKIFDKKHFKNDEYNLWMWKFYWIEEFLKDVEYVALEDYSFASKGLVFNIGEFVGHIKHWLYNNHKKIRKYDVPTIKMFATNSGNTKEVDKSVMRKYYDEYSEKKIDLSFLNPEKSPAVDIVDAFWIAKILQLELQLRKGLISLKDLNEEKIKIFNRTTDKYKENILVRDFLYQEGMFEL